MKKTGQTPERARIFRLLALTAMLAAVLLLANGCVIKPDPTDVDTTADVTLLPFATATPSPTPAPTDAGGWQSWTGDGGYTPPIPVDGTQPPQAAPTIQVITPKPTAKPVWTIQPIATTVPKPTVTPTPDSTLRNGSSGVLVRSLQQQLQALGYYTGSIDGDFGAGTEEAVKAFQAQNGLTPDGVVGAATQEKLFSRNVRPAPSPTPTIAYLYATARPTPLSYTPSTLSTYRFLQMGSTGSDVTRMQERLKELGYFTGTANGTFRESTQAAVIAFQERNGLWVDGVAGEDTQRMLFSSAALPYFGVVAVTPQPEAPQTLKTGSFGADVTSLQTRLAELHYYTGPITGTYDEMTALAVRVFQQRNGLTVDGMAGAVTQNALYAETALSAPTAQPAAGSLKSGSAGAEVYRLQEALYDLGYYTGTIDGLYDEEVTQAVRAFQTANGLSADGKAGTRTQQVLYGGGAKPAGAADATYSTLRAGDSGDRVSALQVLLTNYGYLKTGVTGTYDNATVLAVQQLQAANGLSVDGVAGPATLMLLYSGSVTPQQAQLPSGANFTTLRYGMSGPDVQRMQELLAELGYYTSAVDGDYGYTTQLAVTAFQQINGLKADGVAGSETLALLYSGDGYVAGYATATPRTALRLGDQGADVYSLQERLVLLGYLGVMPDGIYSEATASGVRLFQRANGLTADGVAGEQTMAALYGAQPVGAQTQTQIPLSVVNNRSRELEEQNAGGAIQASISGGGVAASYGGKLYYLGDNGSIFAGNAYGSGEVLVDIPAKFLHAGANGLTFVSGNQIFHASLDGNAVVPLAQAGSVSKFSLVNDTCYYLEGSTLIRLPSTGGSVVMANGVNDFMIDIYDYKVYLATGSGVKRMGLNGSALETLVSSSADQVALADTTVFFRSGGAIYRVENGLSTLLLDPGASWMGVYRDKVYYIAGGCLYRCSTNGTGNELFYDGQTSGVSFAAGRVYITAEDGGGLTKVLSCE